MHQVTPNSSYSSLNEPNSSGSKNSSTSTVRNHEDLRSLNNANDHNLTGKSWKPQKAITNSGSRKLIKDELSNSYIRFSDFTDCYNTSSTYLLEEYPIKPKIEKIDLLNRLILPDLVSTKKMDQRELRPLKVIRSNSYSEYDAPTTDRESNIVSSASMSSLSSSYSIDCGFWQLRKSKRDNNFITINKSFKKQPGIEKWF